MADTVVVTDETAVKTIEKYAEQKDISKAEAAARLVRTARGRINAVRKFAAKAAAERKPKAKKVAPPKAKKVAPPKAKAPVKRKAAAPAVEQAPAPVQVEAPAPVAEPAVS